MLSGKDLVGRAVSPEEVAAALGFGTVQDLRRWETELGQRAATLEVSLHAAKHDAENFKWHIERMLIVLNKTEEALLKLQQGNLDPKEVNKLLLAVRVVAGRGVDWEHTLKDWLEV